LPLNNSSSALPLQSNKCLNITCTSWKSKGEYEIFTFLVNDGIVEWEIGKRYSQCMELNETLLTAFVFVALPNFPPRMFKLFINDESLTERKVGLDRYFQSLPAQIRESDLVREFFRASDSDLKTRPILAHQQTFIPPKLIVEIKEVIDIFQDQLIYLPQDVIFVKAILQETMQYIQSLEEMKIGFDKIFGSNERVTFLMHYQEKRLSFVSNLWGIRHNLEIWLQEPQIIELCIIRDLFQDLTVCICGILNWNQSIDGDTMLELDMQTNIMKKIKDFTEQAEQLVTCYVQGVELEKTKHAIGVLQRKMQTEIVKARQIKSIEVLSKLESISVYITNGIASCEVKANPQETIQQIENEIYKVTTQIENLDADSNSNVVLEVKSLLGDLKKRCANLRINLEKNIPYNKPLIQNIDELQSILGDLFFQFKEKFEDRDDIFTKKIYDSIVEKNEKEQDKFFGL